MRSLSRHHTTCSLILSKLESDRNFVQLFVYDCLPPACRDYRPSTDVMERGNPLDKLIVLGAAGVGNLAYKAFASGASYIRSATEEDIKQVIDKVKHTLREEVELKDVSARSIFSVHTARNILHGSVGEEELTKERIQELLEIVEPYIYGGTPLLGALNKSAELFSGVNFQNQKKLLFVLSDGHPADGGNEEYILSTLKENDVTVVSCFITTWAKVVPYTMYSKLDEEWERGAKFMFNWSSMITTQLLPRTMFVRRGWKLDITNNETKLFLQVNHPDHLKDACDLARDVVTSQETLSDILATVSLDIYINQSTIEFGAKRQIGGTCYANATAAVLHLAMKRILGREGGYPDFDMLRDQMIACYGEHGANTRRVLQEICPQYRLHCQSVDTKGAMLAITSKRPVVARFNLTDREWNNFSNFYKGNPTGVLTTNEIDIDEREPGVKTSGHAVVLTSFNSKCLRLMNSWGTEWADDGFFNVQDADVLRFEFIDVFWTLDDLTSDEKAYYDKHGSEVAYKLIRTLTGLQVAKCQCPLCLRTSKVSQFMGRLTRAKCPICRGEFRCGEAENNLALNLYLTSLCKSDHDRTK